MPSHEDASFQYKLAARLAVVGVWTGAIGLVVLYTATDSLGPELVEAVAPTHGRLGDPVKNAVGVGGVLLYKSGAGALILGVTLTIVGVAVAVAAIR